MLMYSHGLCMRNMGRLLLVLGPFFCIELNRNYGLNALMNASHQKTRNIENNHFCFLTMQSLKMHLKVILSDRPTFNAVYFLQCQSWFV